MPKRTLSKDDAVSLIEKSSLKTVLTEGVTDYSVMRRMEDQLRELEIDFLPVGGRNMVLSVWESLSTERKKSVLAFVDLDDWLYSEIPLQYQEAGIYHTIGYSIENDLFIDGKEAIFRLMDNNEIKNFECCIAHLSNHHALFISQIIDGQRSSIGESAYTLLQKPAQSLNHQQKEIFDTLISHFPQYMRGKTIIETLARNFGERTSPPKFGYDQIFHIALANRAKIFDQHVARIQERFCAT